MKVHPDESPEQFKSRSTVLSNSIIRFFNTFRLKRVGEPRIILE